MTRLVNAAVVLLLWYTVTLPFDHWRVLRYLESEQHGGPWLENECWGTLMNTLVWGLDEERGSVEWTCAGDISAPGRSTCDRVVSSVCTGIFPAGAIADEDDL